MGVNTPIFTRKNKKTVGEEPDRFFLNIVLDPLPLELRLIQLSI